MGPHSLQKDEAPWVLPFLEMPIFFGIERGSRGTICPAWTKEKGRPRRFVILA